MQNFSLICKETNVPSGLIADFVGQKGYSDSDSDSNSSTDTEKETGSVKHILTIQKTRKRNQEEDLHQCHWER